MSELMDLYIVKCYHCFLQKINLENSTFLYQNASLSIGNLNIEAYLLGSSDNYYLQILGEIKEAGEDSNIIDLGNFESTESLNNLTGNLDITLFNTNNLEVRFGIRDSYGGAYHKYNLPYLYNDSYSKEGHLWSEYYFGKEEVIEDILHSYRVTIDNKENTYH